MEAVHGWVWIFSGIAHCDWCFYLRAALNLKRHKMTTLFRSKIDEKCRLYLSSVA